MKKISALLAVLLTTGFLFASAAENIVVKSVKGKVTYETAPGKTQPVKANQTLSLSTFINTGVGAVLVLDIDGKEYTVKSMKKGTVEALTSENVAGLNANPGKTSARSAIASAATSTGMGTATLSGRGNIKDASAVGELDEEIEEIK